MILRVYDKKNARYIGRGLYWDKDRRVDDPDKARIFASLNGIRLSMTCGLPQHNPFEWDWFRVERLVEGKWEEITPNG